MLRSVFCFLNVLVYLPKMNNSPLYQSAFLRSRAEGAEKGTSTGLPFIFFPSQNSKCPPRDCTLWSPFHILPTVSRLVNDSNRWTQECGKQGRNAAFSGLGSLLIIIVDITPLFVESWLQYRYVDWQWARLVAEEMAQRPWAFAALAKDTCGGPNYP